jgi:hypothetical protein
VRSTRTCRPHSLDPRLPLARDDAPRTKPTYRRYREQGYIRTRNGWAMIVADGGVCPQSQDCYIATRAAPQWRSSTVGRVSDSSRPVLEV